MPTLPTLPNEYQIPVVPDFSGYNAYTFDGAATPENLRDFLRGNDVSPWGTLTRPAVIHLDPAIDWVLGGSNTNYFFIDDAVASSNWLWITTLSGNLASIPARGVRIDRDVNGSIMPRLRVTFVNTPTIGINKNVDKVRFYGLRITRDDSNLAGSMMYMGRSLDIITQPVTEAELCEDIIVDHCSFYPQQASNTLFCRTGIELNCNGGAVIDSEILEMRDTSDAQAIRTFQGGTHCIENNRLQATAENYLTGGTGISVAAPHQPHDIVFRGNHCDKPTKWDPNHPDYEGVSWIIKNLFETKFQNKILIDGNVFQTSWFGSQWAGIVLKASNQPKLRTDLAIDAVNNNQVTSASMPFTAEDQTYGNNINIIAGGGPGFNLGFLNITSVSGGVATLSGSAGTPGSTGGWFYKGETPWVSSDDITFRDNLVLDVRDGFTVVPTSDLTYKTQDGRRWLIENNFVQSRTIHNTGAPTYKPASILWGGTNKVNALQHCTIRHNTFVHGDVGDSMGSSIITLSINPTGAFVDQLDIRDNIFQHGEFGVIRNSTTLGTVSMESAWSNFTWTNNLLYNGNTASSRNHPNQYTGAGASWHETAASDVGFRDQPGFQFALSSAGTSGDYRAGGDRQASDGKDLGVDWPRLERAIAGVVAGLKKEKLPVLVMV